MNLEGAKNNIGNYKGVMLCTRPNEAIGQPKEKPFISRVDPKEALGTNPVLPKQARVNKKKVNPILLRHRQWLEAFKEKARKKREEEQEKERQEFERYTKIREQQTQNRHKTKENKQDYEVKAETYNSAPVEKKTQEQVVAANPQTGDSPQNTAKKSALKKSFKPKWAYTEEQLQNQEEQEVDDLLNFTQGLDYDKYIDDLEVKNMVSALKERINTLKKEEEQWKEKIVNAWNNDEDIRNLKPSKVNVGDDDDNRSDVGSMVSGRSEGGKSVASERSQRSIAEIKKRMVQEKKEWDNISTASEKKQVTLEERIAKHVADEILRGNTQIRHVHSNNSIRKLLEREAQKHLDSLKDQKINPPNIVENKDKHLRSEFNDPNTLPYLHRNPAI